MTENRRILVTSALPYANGSLHLGHMVEMIQTDIWVRFQKMRGHECYYVCASDAHGTPIMLRALREKRDPEQLVEHYKTEHKKDMVGFGIGLDNFYSTHSEENRQLVNAIYQRLKAGGHISEKSIEQAYDPIEGVFLPDRYIKGECPICGNADQYGDHCENCGRTYESNELKNPVSVLSGATPEQRQSLHYFFELDHFASVLKDWVHSDAVPTETANKLNEWLNETLRAWDISRDAPYFGFNVPGTKDKFFYVWLDAPVGYMASFKNMCDKNDKPLFDDFWQAASPCELYHFIGKDIAAFHGLFWPAMLHGAGYRMPTAICVHGFLTINDEKLSKSRGVMLGARQYLNHLNPECLRYYIAARMSNGVDDIDLNFSDFTSRVNADLVGKFVNIASRCASFITRHFDGKLSHLDPGTDLWQRVSDAAPTIEDYYENRETSKAIREIMELADLANQYINDKAPWKVVKQNGATQEVHAVLTTALDVFRLLVLYLKPVLPRVAEQAEAFLNLPALRWQDHKTPLKAHGINPYQPLMQRLNPNDIEKMMADNQQTTEQSTPAQQTEESFIAYDDFAKIDLRVAKIVKAENVEGADKLLKLTLDIGETNPRTVFAGIKAKYTPEDLNGRLTVMVANLTPRKMRFGVSEGMVLAAGPGGSDIWLIAPDSGAHPGMEVK